MRRDRGGLCRSSRGLAGAGGRSGGVRLDRDGVLARFHAREAEASDARVVGSSTIFPGARRDRTSTPCPFPSSFSWRRQTGSSRFCLYSGIASNFRERSTSRT